MSQYVAKGLSTVFAHIHWFMAAFIFVAGWTTIIAFLTVGQKSAHYLWPRHGKKVYFVYAIAALWFFSFFDQTKVIIIMSISGGLLVLCNLLGMLRLRHEVEFE